MNASLQTSSLKHKKIVIAKYAYKLKENNANMSTTKTPTMEHFKIAFTKH